MRSLAAPLAPSAWLLSNGRYHVLVSGAGGGQSRWKELALNRWRGDAEDEQGFFIYLRDLESGGFWSATKHPVRGDGEATYADGSVALSRAHDGIESRLEIAVSSEDDVEVRRLKLRNTSGRRRRIEVTSYFEVVLNYAGADAAHPAFSKLFVETEVAGNERTLLARRRPRGNDEHWPWLFHALAGASASAWESDRMRFVGRGGTASRPAALTSRDELSGAAGNVLDPIASLRTIVELDAGAEAELGFLTGIAADRDGALATAGRLRDASNLERVFASARETDQALCKQVGITAQQAERFQSIGGAMSYASRSLRAARPHLEPSSNVDDTFGRLRVPRDRPTIVALLDWSHADLADIVAARKYWGGKGLYTNLVVVTKAEAKQPDGLDDRVFTLKAADVARLDLDHLLVAAHLVIGEDAPATAPRAKTSAPRPAAAKAARSKAPASAPAGLQSWNGFGGFSADGSEYVVHLPWQDDDLRRPPLPWINVVANENSGFLVSECGAGYTWARNSQANRLTPWSNDPVSDPHGEAFYLRDEDSGEVWSPAPGPAPAPCDYQARHGFGDTRFLCSHGDIELETSFFVPRADPVRIVHLRMTNRGVKPRRLAVYSYQRLVLGGAPESPSLILTEQDTDRDLLLARTCKGGEFRGTAVFAAAIASGAQVGERSFTCDRTAFLGQEGNVADPAAVRAGGPLGGEVGAGLDPCLAQRVSITLAPQATAECALLLGESPDASAAGALVEKYRASGAVSQARDEARSFWSSLLSGLRVDTPSPAIDLMVNGWLPYQVLACRMWARSAFFQSGGAYGYRDQLQDSAALVYLRPELTRAQILLHARHQFAEGDVMHWWHPDPIGRGLRTRFSDDLLWLPYLACVYVDATGDEGILAEVEPFLKARLLADGEDESYLPIEHAGETGDLYEHCCRAIDKSLTRGPHGIPLMGTGDWNDGMNRVGREGKGESVWLGFFLAHILDLFRPICRKRGDHARDDRYASYAADLAKALNGAGWDGEWYRRAYYDDGTPLGTASDTECRIDAIAQAWAVISGVAPADKANAALDAAEKHLISEKGGIIRLLTPAFVNTPHDPGYIKGYVAGVRENGGQYTHGACWVVRAMAELGRHERATQLLEMISPVSHARSEERAMRYKLEPYVIGADVYGEPPHVGRGGWSWYTGSAAWMYRIALETILGFRIEGGNTLVIEPRVPDDWPSYRIAYRHPPTGATYEIAVENPGKSARGVKSVELDGRPLAEAAGTARIPLATDAQSHTVKLVLG